MVRTELFVNYGVRVYKDLAWDDLYYRQKKVLATGSSNNPSLNGHMTQHDIVDCRGPI